MSRLTKFTAYPMRTSENANDLCRIGCASFTVACNKCCWYEVLGDYGLCDNADNTDLETPRQVTQLVKEHL